MTANNAATTAQAYFDAWNRHNVSDILSVFAPDATFWDTTMLAPVPVSTLESAFQQTLDQFTDFRFVVERVLETESAFAVVEWRMQGASKASNSLSRIDIPGVDVFEVENGKIRAARAYFNAQTMAQQLA